MMTSIRYLLCLGILAVAPGAASATRIMSPLRDLTPQEHLDYTVGASDGILLAAIEAVTDTLLPVIVSSGADSDQKLVPRRFLVLRPIEWLKGRDLAPRIVVNVWPTGAIYSKLDNAKRSSIERGVFFLRRINRARSTRLPAAAFLPEDIHWDLNSDPSHYLHGSALASRGHESSDDDIDIRRSIARLSVESLAQKADLIVVGRVNGRGRSATVNRRVVLCAEVDIDSVISGAVPGRTLAVYSVIPGWISSGTSLLILKRTGSAVYEVSGIVAGAMSVAGERVLSQDATVSDIARRIRMARKAPAAEPLK